MKYRVYLCGVDERLVRHPCPKGGPDHAPAPSGYVEWHHWADKMSKTHRQVRCGHCGLYGFHVLKEKTRR